MEAKIIQIGNSRGLRLSKTVLDKYDIKDKVELVLEKDHILIRAISNPREGWDEEFLKMHKNGHDKLFVSDVFEDEQFEEWK